MNVLGLFNEKADRLLSLSYWRKSQGAGAVVEWKRGRGWDSVFVGADEESLEALVLTTRLFVQNNERISLRNTRLLYERLPVDPALAASVQKQCAELNSFLDSDTELAIQENRQLTYRQILEIFLYGGYAHTSRAKRRTFEAIRATPFLPIFQTCLVNTLVRLARTVRSIRSCNEQALDQLSKRRRRF